MGTGSSFPQPGQCPHFLSALAKTSSNLISSFSATYTIHELREETKLLETPKDSVFASMVLSVGIIVGNKDMLQVSG